MVLSAPGIPMIFMGQEFLEYRPFPNYGADPQPIDWSRKDTYNGIWTLYRDMIQLRRNWYNNTRGFRGQTSMYCPCSATICWCITGGTRVARATM